MASPWFASDDARHLAASLTEDLARDVPTKTLSKLAPAMNRSSNNSTNRTTPGLRAGRRNVNSLPVATFRQRGIGGAGEKPAFFAQEDWHAPRSESLRASKATRFIVQPAGANFVHAVTIGEVRERLAQLPRSIIEQVEVIQLSRMTRKRQLFPCYGMQWGASVYLYPIEDSLIENYSRPPTPQQQIEARMFGGVWSASDGQWTLTWTPENLKDFYLNNVLIHEIGHVLDKRNTRTEDRERYANWFAIEYGYRASRGRK
jgi:hypothetical protein